MSGKNCRDIRNTSATGILSGFVFDRLKWSSMFMFHCFPYLFFDIHFRHMSRSCSSSCSSKSSSSNRSSCCSCKLRSFISSCGSRCFIGSGCSRSSFCLIICSVLYLCVPMFLCACVFCDQFRVKREFRLCLWTSANP